MSDLAAPAPLRAVAQNLRGIALLIAGIALFSIQDLILKLLSGAYPLSEAMVFRSLTATPLIWLLVHFDGGSRTLFTPGTKRMIGRGFIVFAPYTLYYLALAALPIATVVALFFAAPLFITLLSVPVLGEKVGRMRWSAVVIGFGGVILMARPGTDLFDWAALLAVAAAACYALAMISARQLGRSETASAMAFWGNAVFLLCAGLLSLIFGSGHFEGATHKSLAFLTRAWVMPSSHDLMLMCACGVIAAIALTLLTQAYRLGEASIVASFEYTAMIWGVLYGWMFFRDWPTRTGWLGIGIITGAGLFVLWREYRAKRS
jgi:drug/metabolite transporter (DMT)-like permease